MSANMADEAEGESTTNNVREGTIDPLQIPVSSGTDDEEDIIAVRKILICLDLPRLLW